MADNINQPNNEPDITYMTTNINVRFVALSAIQIPIKYADAVNTVDSAQNEEMTNLFHQMAAYSDDTAGKHKLVKFHQTISRYIRPNSQMEPATIRHAWIRQANLADEFSVPHSPAPKKRVGIRWRRSFKGTTGEDEMT